MASRTTVAVNGPALRVIRTLTGVTVQGLADQLGLTRAYITKIELGHSPRVSPKVFADLCAALNIADRRALMANPGATDDAGAAA